MAGQVDRFGRPIPADPGYKEIINDDGSTVQQRTTLYLGADIIATDDPDSDATRLNVSLPNPGFPFQVVASVTGTLRSMGNLPTDGTLYQTREYGVYGTGVGGWSYRWNAASTATDDGVLVIKADFLDTGRFLAVMPPDGIMNALACGPAAADLGTRTKSFDPAGVVEVGAECYRITRILREAGWSGLEVPNAGPYYLCTGTHIQVAPSSNPGVPFYFGSKSGAKLQGLIGDHVAVVGLGAMARGLGDTATVQSLIAPDFNSTCVPFTQTILGTEKTFVGIDTDDLDADVGDTVIVYIGADITDGSGIQYEWLMSEIESISFTAAPIADITLKQGVPYAPLPSTSGSRGPQTHHTMRKIIGFQDGTEIRGFRLNNVSIGIIYGRNCTIDCHWETAIFQHNHWGTSGLSIPHWTSDIITGYDIGEGALSWYGLGLVLQQCYETNIGMIRCENLDGVPLITEEIDSRGTHIGLIECNWNAANSWNTNCAIVGATGGSTDIISIDHMVLTGGYGFASVVRSCHVGVYEDRGSPEYEGVSMSPVQCERIFWKGQGYNARHRDQIIIPVVDGESFWKLPFSGLIRQLFVRVSTPGAFTTFASVGITTLGVDDGNNDGHAADIVSGVVTAKDRWFPAETASVLIVGYPNGRGSCNPQIHIVGSGVPDGTFLHIDVEMFLPDLATSGQVDTAQGVYADMRGSDGAPSFNANRVGQVCIDSSASPRDVYMSINVGTGATDWVKIS